MNKRSPAFVPPVTPVFSRRATRPENQRRASLQLLETVKAKLIASLAFALCFGGLLPEKAEAGRPYVSGGYYVTRTVGYDYYGRPIVRRVWIEIGPRYYAPPPVVRHYHYRHPAPRHHHHHRHYHHPQPRGHHHHHHHRR